MMNKLQAQKSASGVCRIGASVLWVFVLLAAPTKAANAQHSTSATFTDLYSFHTSSGEYPLAGLILDSQGNLYGTTSEGGREGGGTVFKVDSGGKETVLHSFASGTSDGRFPIAPLVRDSVGNLYGTTTLGGAWGYGTVFKVNENGVETILFSFGATEHDGRYPSAGLLLGSTGSLYGTTQEGGAFNLGTIFKLDSAGKETLLHSFAGNPADGQYPVAGLVSDGKGSFYGATELGGAGNDGTVFKFDTKGHETVLLSFPGGSSGAYPFGGVIVDAKGNLYGTTAYGGNGPGLVFKLDPSGNESVIYTFTGSGSDGLYPSSSLVRDFSGNLYGTTEFGGSKGGGVVYKVWPGGKLTVLHGFNGANGADVLTPLVLDSAGNLYGTTTEGGAEGQGTVFKLNQ